MVGIFPFLVLAQGMSGVRGILGLLLKAEENSLQEEMGSVRICISINFTLRDMEKNQQAICTRAIKPNAKCTLTSTELHPQVHGDCRWSYTQYS